MQRERRRWAASILTARRSVQEWQRLERPIALTGIKVSDPSDMEALNSQSLCLSIISAAMLSQTYSSKQDKGMQISLHICIC